MFGKRRITPEPPYESDTLPGRVAPRSPNDSLKPIPVNKVRVRRPRGGLLSLLSGLTTVAVVVCGTLVFGLLALEGEVEKPGPLLADKTVLIPKSVGTSDIADLLTREGVIGNPTLFELFSYLNRSKGQLKAGEFLFRAGISIDEAIDTLIQGRAILHTFTLPEGLTSEQIVTRIRENDILTGTINEVPREGSLMPDTYKIERGETRQQFVNRMQAAGRDVLAKTWSGRAPDLAIKTPQELVILASIVERETGRADERPRVASVFLNRLARRMKLQSDPTIVYGIVGGKGTLGRGITRAEIDRPTPYNTYVIEGLPPGPIANPGRAALEAVAKPLKTKDVFFVADGTGGHVFAETYDQHQRNVARWRQIEREREVAGSGASPVDRPAPPADNRTQYDAAPTSSGAVSAYADPSARSAGRGFDASEGTLRDPLRNQSWDLTTPKNVPNVGQEASALPAAPARTRAAARPARRQPRGQEGTRREAEVLQPPPGFETPRR
ncbi:endolytic transglycosylase MltG [uncultured Enterovirga sp.]|uniref:endolytic transglycosylase MltG n=1 Tax=uncultured Enterovirga sp. TaxID=2026352 RepID=UPI0035CC9F3E